MFQLPRHSARRPRHGKGLFHLPQNLRFADYHRVEARGYAEDVLYRVTVPFFVDMGL